ncbi:hypothetical protein BZG36_04709 [Bifiguratus adelaidae]|uniref:Uncharacterized protein n=1 Tax=Bifiguratus adelaidae TaxID=1938954 RepID=A0A261XWM9_9FUNG|nr:hypothetical protein BZG36_04709 [Bifiguratus adelaidae]
MDRYNPYARRTSYGDPRDSRPRYERPSADTYRPNERDVRSYSRDGRDPYPPPPRGHRPDSPRFYSRSHPDYDPMYPPPHHRGPPPDHHYRRSSRSPPSRSYYERDDYFRDRYSPPPPTGPALDRRSPPPSAYSHRGPTYPPPSGPYKRSEYDSPLAGSYPYEDRYRSSSGATSPGGNMPPYPPRGPRSRHSRSPVDTPPPPPTPPLREPPPPTVPAGFRSRTASIPMSLPSFPPPPAGPASMVSSPATTPGSGSPHAQRARGSFPFRPALQTPQTKVSWAPEPEKEVAKQHAAYVKLQSEEVSLMENVRKAEYELAFLDWEVDRFGHQLELVQGQMDKGGFYDILYSATGELGELVVR